jgi:hypothetical protein
MERGAILNVDDHERCVDSWSSDEEDPFGVLGIGAEEDPSTSSHVREADNKDAEHSSVLDCPSRIISGSALAPLHIIDRQQECRRLENSYHQLRHISEGTYGIVWKARDIGECGAVIHHFFHHAGIL